MSFFSKLFGTAAAVGTGAAAVKVKEKFDENNPDGIKDVTGDGVIDAQDYAVELKKAAMEVYAETSEKVQEKAPELIAKAKDKAPEIKEKAEKIADEAKEKVKEAIGK